MTQTHGFGAGVVGGGVGTGAYVVGVRVVGARVGGSVVGKRVGTHVVGGKVGIRLVGSRVAGGKVSGALDTHSWADSSQLGLHARSWAHTCTASEAQSNHLFSTDFLAWEMMNPTRNAPSPRQ